MPNGFKITRTVEFGETDMAGLMHFSHYFRWMEACEAAFLRKRGLALIERVGSQLRGWPRVRASCDYMAPLHLGDVVEVRLNVEKVGVKSLHLTFTFLKKKTPRGSAEPVATGSMVTAYVVGVNGRMKAQQIPAKVRTQLTRKR